MKKTGTKRMIMEKALDLFARQGYEGVSVAEIADAVGIRAPSLYKHYASKQEIYDAILTEMEERYRNQAAALQMDGTDASLDTALFAGIGADRLIGMGKTMFLYFLHDEYARKFRRMLAIEQFSNPQAARLYAEQYVDSPIAYQSALFSAFLAQGLMRDVDARTAAMHFYAPMFLMLCLCDSCPEREEEALLFVEQHFRQFTALYMKGDPS